MMIDDFAEVPFDWIVEDLRKGLVIPFLGAGASVFLDGNARPPTASELALTLAKRSRYPDYEDAHALSAVASETEQHFLARADCRNLSLMSSWVELFAGDRERIRDELREAFAHPERPISFNPLHALLADIARASPLAIITTNYDDLMEQALIAAGVPFDLMVLAIDRSQSIPASGNSALVLFRRAGEAGLSPATAETQLLDIEMTGRLPRLQRTFLLKIHGHIDRDSEDYDTFVITEDDYVNFLGRMGDQGSIFPADLVAFMVKRRILFLGYGLRDWNMRVLLDRMTRMRGSANPLKSYAISLGVPDAQKVMWEKRSVKVYNTDLNVFVKELQNKFAQSQFA
jgi:hypothetical protein